MTFKLMPEYAAYRKYYMAAIPVLVIILNSIAGWQLDESVYPDKLEQGFDIIFALIIPILVQVKPNGALPASKS